MCFGAHAGPQSSGVCQATVTVCFQLPEEFPQAVAAGGVRLTTSTQ